MGREEAILRQWMDVGITETGAHMNSNTRKQHVSYHLVVPLRCKFIQSTNNTYQDNIN